jgi:LmbE family N-acetylglucosaminyl deacetylase
VTAASILGLPEQAIDFLRLPDRAVPSAGAEFTHAVTCVRAAARAADAGSVFVTWRHDPHCDHQAAFAIARAAVLGLQGARLYAYPVWGWTLADETLLDEPEPIGGQLDIGPYLVRKRRAIQAHRSQMTGLIEDDPVGFQLPPALLAQFDQPRETFLEIAP